MPPASTQRKAGGVVVTRRDADASEAANGYRILFLSLRRPVSRRSPRSSALMWTVSASGGAGSRSHLRERRPCYYASRGQREELVEHFSPPLSRCGGLVAGSAWCPPCWPGCPRWRAAACAFGLPRSTANLAGAMAFDAQDPAGRVSDRSPFANCCSARVPRLPADYGAGAMCRLETSNKPLRKDIVF